MHKNKQKPRLSLSTKLLPFIRVRLAFAQMANISVLIRTIWRPCWSLESLHTARQKHCCSATTTDNLGDSEYCNCV